MKKNDLSQKLHIAVYNGDFETVREILDNNNVNSVIRGYTPLHWAAQEGFVEIANYLIKHGANLDCYDEDGFSPLLLAIGEDNLKVVQLLISNGALINYDKKFTHDSPLRKACAYNRAKIVKILLENGAEKEEKDSEGKTPIFYGVEYGNYKVVTIMINFGANVNIEDNSGNTPVMIAEKNGDKKMQKILSKTANKITKTEK